MIEDECHVTCPRSSPLMQYYPILEADSHSHCGTPAEEYSGFDFGTPNVAIDPGTFVQQPSIAPRLQPLGMPQWPSMLSSQSHATFPPMCPPPVQPFQPVSMVTLQTPVSTTPIKSASTPRKMLTDLDRERMCQYAEDHPNSKQTDIGGM